ISFESRLLLNLQRNDAAILQRIASTRRGDSSNPLQTEPPRMQPRYVNLQVKRGSGGKRRYFRFPPAALRRFRRAKAAVWLRLSQ
ncbi:MAG: hypothetical protein J6M10_07420, partial [Clostridia bacterium]|nr:hypothetical protein [Clostridia bacterium]